MFGCVSRPLHRKLNDLLANVFSESPIERGWFFQSPDGLHWADFLDLLELRQEQDLSRVIVSSSGSGLNLLVYGWSNVSWKPAEEGCESMLVAVFSWQQTGFSTMQMWLTRPSTWFLLSLYCWAMLCEASVWHRRKLFVVANPHCGAMRQFPNSGGMRSCTARDVLVLTVVQQTAHVRVHM